MITLGVLSTALCFLLLFEQKRGPHEFGYAPFLPDGLPWSAMRGFTWEQAHSHLYRLALLGPGLVLLSSGLSTFWQPHMPEERFFRRATIVAGTFCVLAMSFVMLVILRGRAIVDDELVYRMQASALARGRLTLPDVGFLPPDVFSIEARGGYTGKYLPGEPLVQIPGLALGVPALGHLPLTALMLWLWYRTLSFEFEARTAYIATTLLAICPMLVLTGATGLSHLSALFWVVTGGFGLGLARRGRPFTGATLLGASFALCFLTRPQVALPAHGVLMGSMSLLFVGQKNIRGLIALLLTATAGLTLVGLYNHALSGSWLKLPWFLQCGAERYGFGQVWPCDAFRHTPLTALENLAVTGVRFNAFWLGFPISLGLLLFWRRVRARLDRGRVWLAVGLAVLLFETGYYSTGISDTGPVYHFELILPASILGARLIVAAWQRLPTLVPAALLVHLLLGTGSFFVEHMARLARLVDSIHRDTDDVLSQIDRLPALIIHEHWSREVLYRGWVMDSFPKRFRDPEDSIVTMPRLPKDALKRVLESYPGRSCFYYHRRWSSGALELLPCERAEEYLARPFLDTDPTRPRSLWQPPTAYKKVRSFDPFELMRRRNASIDREQCVLCCTAARLAKAGQPLAETKCIEAE